MNKKYSFNTFCAVLFFSALFLCPLISKAESAEVIKQRMESRLNSINSLKAKGIIGENSKGFLAFVGSAKEGDDIVKAENADRASVYAAIAKKQNTTAELVGNRRALQLSQTAKAGEYVQNDKGVWSKK